MSLAPSTRLGPYEIVSSLGVGGMGEVYKARDTRLDRTVAIKVMSAVMAATPELRQRFEREARSLSALNHPHICTLHDLGQQDGVDYLVLEFVQGETLATRLERGPLPMDDVIRRGIELTGALDRAHRAGVVHRDFKPANIMLTKSGAKILDFGLARLKAVGPPEAVSLMTVANPALTGEGAILGTLQYMSPEQLNGGEIDARSDIFAFGAVLYEMATGRRAFDSTSQASLIAAILEREPAPMRGSARGDTHVPDALERIVRRCLAKDPDDRWQSARDLMHELEAIGEASVPRPVPVAAAKRALSPAWIVAVMAAVGGLALAAWALRSAPVEPQELRLQIVTPPTASPTSFALSPDGRRVAFVASRKGSIQPVLWVRDLDTVASQHVPGTDGANFPFWSADGRSVAFFADAKLQRYDLASDAVQTLASAPQGRGGAWNQDGVIVFAPTIGGFSRIPASGGKPQPLTQISAPHEASHRFPQFFPDGRRFLYFVQGSTEAQGIYLASLDQPKGRRLVATDTRGVLVGGERLLFVRQGTLYAQPLDAAGTPTGEPAKVAEHVLIDGSFNTAGISASRAGMVAYREGSANELKWFDRTGRPAGTVAVPDGSPQNCPELSPDGRQVVFDRTVNGNRDIWIFEVERAILRRLTTDTGIDATPLWSPDAARILFRSNRTGLNQLYVKATNGVGEERSIPVRNLGVGVSDWSPDGRTILFTVLDPVNALDLWAMPADGDTRTPVPVANTPFEERDGQFSPDGKWLAFADNESGQLEIYLQPFPAGGARHRISTAGGTQPRWRRDGRELYFLGADGAILAVPVMLSAGGVTSGVPTPLFTPRITSAQGGLLRHQYAVSADGTRFLVNAVSEEAANAPINIIVNWRGPAGDGKGSR